MKVLVVEDDPVNVRLLSRILVKQSYDVTVAGDGVDGLKEVKKSRFDALLVDWMIPKMDGIEFIRRARETLDPVPLIIMITAIDLPAARNHALNSGADVFITKPYSSVEVMQTLYDGLARLSQPAPTDLRVSALAPNTAAVCGRRHSHQYRRPSCTHRSPERTASVCYVKGGVLPGAAWPGMDAIHLHVSDSR